MRNLLVTFSGKAYDETTRITVERGPSLGNCEVWVYDDKWLMEQTGYYRTNRWLFDATSRIQDEPTVYRHGFGWCSWKAFLVLSAWDRLEDGDVALYLDADTYPIAPFAQLFDMCRGENGVLIFAETANNARFTKAECMLAMGLPVEDGPHACGRFSLWQKGSFLARQMLAEWWAYSINPRCTLWGRSTMRLNASGQLEACGEREGDPPEYYRNSTEQSVLSNLGIKYKLPFHRTPDQNGGNPKPGEAPDAEWYPQVFEQRWCAGNREDHSGSSFRNVP